MERVDALVAAGVDAIVIDTAHGHSRGVASVLKAVKTKYPELDVVVGNIATGDAARYLVECGADGVKVGIGAVFLSYAIAVCRQLLRGLWPARW